MEHKNQKSLKLDRTDETRKCLASTKETQMSPEKQKRNKGEIEKSKEKTVMLYLLNIQFISWLLSKE